MFHPRFLATLLLPVCLAAGQPVFAQVTAPAATAAAPAASGAAGSEGPTDKRIQRIRIEDSGARIDELRVGGETQTITVSPKGGLPAYDVAPSSANQAPSTQGRDSATTSGASRGWKVLGF